MGKVKTASDYAAEIRTFYPDQDKLKNRVPSFVDHMDITIFQAQQEHIREDKLGWTSEDLGWSIRPMQLKQDTGIHQVGDYQAHYSCSECSGWVGLLVERKGGKYGPEDLYSTLMNKDNCERFYREIETFQKDKRFSQMVVIAECSFEQFLLYKPAFIGKSRNTSHIGASVEARRGKVASLYARGIPVIFAGTRLNATKIYKALVRQWLIKNISTVLKLDEKPYDDLSHLQTKKARLEAELKGVEHYLRMLEALQ